jgi:hypothetical protein
VASSTPSRMATMTSFSTVKLMLAPCRVSDADETSVKRPSRTEKG